MEFWVIQSLNGISFGLLLFLLAAGLSLIFGLMKILNLAHGSFYLLGAYIGLSVYRWSDSYPLAVLTSSLAIGVVGIVMERFFLRRIFKDDMAQVLLTFGFLFIIADVAIWVWGGKPQVLDAPPFMSGPLDLGAFVYPKYRIVVIGIGIVMAVALWMFQERTKLGAVLRAGVDDEEMAQGVGINMPLIFTGTFALGALLAGFAGTVGVPMVGAQPGKDFEVLLFAFVVVIVGGMGSLKGAIVASLLVGLVDSYGRAWVPDLALFTLYVPMVVILVLKPQGLFGRA